MGSLKISGQLEVERIIHEVENNIPHSHENILNTIEILGGKKETFKLTNSRGVDRAIRYIFLLSIRRNMENEIRRVRM